MSSRQLKTGNSDAGLSACRVVIVNWKSADYLSGCLETLRSQTHTSLHVVVVDNDSGSDERQRLARLPIDDLILNSSNRGFAAAVNQGLEDLSEDLVLLLNPDTRILDSAVDDLIRFLKLHPGVSAVAPALYNEDGSRHRSVLPLPSPFGLWFRLLPPVRLVASLLWKYQREDRSRPVSGVWGTVLLFRREVLSEIGWFDEGFFLYVEDSDFFRRMKEARLRTSYLPTARITHFGGVSQSRSATDREELNWNNLVRYFHKHHSLIDIRINLRLLRALMRLENLFRPGFWSPTVLEILKEAPSHRFDPQPSAVPADSSLSRSDFEDP